MASAGKSGVVLIGYRGSGKSTVGARLAKCLGMPFVDTDALVIQEAGMSIAEIFAREGEEGFRQREVHAVSGISDQQPAVISAGGGMVLNEGAMSTLKSGRRVVWLTARPAVLAARIAADGSDRPPLTELPATREVETVLARREPLYRRWADVRFSTEDEPAERVAGRIAEWLDAR